MPSDAFNGSTLTFEAAAQGDIIDIAVTENGNPVDVTNISSAMHLFVPGKSDFEITITTTGVSSLDIGDVGSMSIAWNDGTTETFSSQDFVVTAKDRSGGLDGAINTSITFKPSAVAAP